MDDDVQEMLVKVNPSTTILSGHDQSMISSRPACFLLPHCENPPNPPSAAAVIPISVPAADLQVKFERSWSGSPVLWRDWLAHLRPTHEALWKEVGILDGLVTSSCRFKRDETSLLEIARFWSPKTNTFIFPWGEATVTLEDIAVLGGLPVLGSYVREKSLPEEVQEDVKELEKQRRILNASKSKKPTFSGWVNHFKKCMPTERIEHAAFLAMWLSMFVLKEAPFDVVRPDVFPIAARMAHGQGVALAPAALASLYRGLSSLKGHISRRNGETFVVGTPLNVLQLWVWERFPALRPSSLSPLQGPQLPRAARWDSVQTNLESSTVCGELESPTQFEWMPYRSTNAALVERGSWVSGCDIVQSKELQSFARYIHPCHLIGLKYAEMYHPHRVARQLGFDQDVPGTFARVRTFCKNLWRRYDLNPQCIAFFIPESEPGITTNYMKWWKKIHSTPDVSKKRMAAVIQDGGSTSTEPGIKRQRQGTQPNQGCMSSGVHA